ncbi:TolC family protein [Massilia sp. erpn]|uniref:TolC family protein n=1 Tax=Massilia sp. erpn TaxID=2738142 RepID=UPI002106C855|nr:TolC family protein [Massilia sp. erpn]UTY57613.1 TolC family protein [Massilia sp. erpn]
MLIRSRCLPLLLPLSAALVLSGCASYTPTPLKQADLAAASRADRQRAQQDVVPLQGPLSLDEAVARALKYNLARRTRLMEESLAQGQLEVGAYDMLPKLVASAGYRERDKDLITRSKDSVTGRPSLANPYISSDRDAVTTDLSFTWSLLDFGQSYYATQQNADRVLIAAEHRRKAMHNLIQDVRTAFWRAVSAQKLQGKVQAGLSAAEAALADSRKAEAERLRNPLDALRYQRQVLENVRLLEAVSQELSTARLELAALVNLPLVQDFTVSEPAETAAAAWHSMPVEQLEEFAIANNAELRESFYNARIASAESRRALLKLFPGLSFSYGPKHSNDSYLINQTWRETGAQISFNLLGLLSAPSQMRLADAGVAVADQRRVMTQMALLAQVHIARLQYGNALRQFERANTIWQLDSSIAQHVANAQQAQTQTQLELVSNQTTALLSELRRFQALAQLHAATGKLQATLGLEPAVSASADLPLDQLTAAVGSSMRQWEAGQLPAVSAQ